MEPPFAPDILEANDLLLAGDLQRAPIVSSIFTVDSKLYAPRRAGASQGSLR